MSIKKIGGYFPFPFSIFKELLRPDFTQCSSFQKVTEFISSAILLYAKADASVQNPEDDGALVTSYSVFVVEPGAAPVEKSGSGQDCSWGPVWLIYLCIVVMLIINLFLCSAMSCACSKSKEKDVSYLEDFDPYARSWQGSQYGSRKECIHVIIYAV